MVEIAAEKSIRSAGDKVIIAYKSADITAMLTRKEDSLKSCIRKQTAKDGICAYDICGYKVFATVVQKKINAVDWQQLGGEIYNKIKNCREVKIEIEGATPDCIYELMFGLDMASYRFDKYFTTKPETFFPKLEKVILTGRENVFPYKDYACLFNAVRYARDLINEPANNLTPEIFAADIKRLEYLGLDIEILDDAMMKEQGFNLALSVAQGSVNKPRIAVIRWHGDKDSESYKVGLVGKGVTFDSGGISIKPAANMGDMKQDMAGAAVMVSVMKSLALQQVKQNVAAVVGLVENMPSGSATRPGDIVRSMSGQTVEIVNTDAEGRLVLADCLTYIQKRFKPEYLIDMATLTGAIVIALGHTYAGMFCNTQSFALKLEDAGKECGELLWNMPMHKDFDKMMDSDIADMKNSGGRAAGSASAACFLQRYVEKGRKWAHLDIAGMDLSDGSKVLYPKGASGYGVRLLNGFIRSL